MPYACTLRKKHNMKTTFILPFLLLSCFLANAQLRIKAVGDIMMGSKTPRTIVPPNNGQVFIDSTAHLLEGADITFGNLEGVFVTPGIEPQKCSKASREAKRCYEFGMNDSLVYTLKELHFDILSMDNNHNSDYGPKGVAHTKKKLGELEMQFASKKSPTTMTRQGKKIAFVAFGHSSISYHVADLENTRKVVSSLKKNHDLVFVSFHGGAEGFDAQHTPNKQEEYYGENRGNVIAFAHTAIDAGADLVIGHGPHVLRGLELYKGRLICYSLGNFLTYGNVSLTGVKGKTCVMDLYVSPETGEFIGGQIIPGMQHRPGIPVYDPSKDAIKIIKGLTNSDFPKSRLIIEDDGRLRNPDYAPIVVEPVVPKPTQEEFHQEIKSLYALKPSIADSTFELGLDSIWNKVEGDTTTYLPFLREELQRLTDVPQGFYTLGSAELLKLSDTPKDQLQVLHVLKSHGHQNVNLIPFVAILRKLSKEGYQVEALVHSTLEHPDMSHELRQELLVFHLLEKDPDFPSVSVNEKMLALLQTYLSENHLDMIKEDVLKACYYTTTCETDQVIDFIKRDKKTQTKPLRKFSKSLLKQIKKVKGKDNPISYQQEMMKLYQLTRKPEHFYDKLPELSGNARRHLKCKKK